MRPVRLACTAQSERLFACELSPRELQEIRPESGRLSFLFLRDYAQLVELDLAQLLTRKYTNLHIIDGYGNRLDVADDLDRLEGSSEQQQERLQVLAGRHGIDTSGMSELEMKLAIRDARNETAHWTVLPMVEAGAFGSSPHDA